MKFYDNYKNYFSDLKNKKQVIVHCPFHDDGTPSLSINLDNGLFKCFACNESGNYEQFIKKINNEPKTIKKEKNYLPKTKLTLEEYSKLKKLPIEYLKNTWKLANYKNGVIIPYLDDKSNVAKRKIRYGNKMFEYLDKDKPLCLYGLQNIELIRKQGYVILVEGESDTQTLTYAGYPVLGVPGANIFKEEWLKYLKGLEIIIYKEPDDGGTKFATNIYKLLIKSNHIKSISLIGFHDEKIKDPSDLFMQSETVEKFKELFDKKMKGKWIMKKDNTNFMEILGNIIIPSGFQVDEKGVWFTKSNDEVNLICSTPIVITKITKDTYSGLEKAEVSYYKNNKWHTALYSKDILFSGKNSILNEIGIDFVTRNSSKVQEYLWQYINTNKINTKNSVSQYGWYKDLFVPYASGDLIVDIPGEFGKMSNAYSTKGTLEEWTGLVKPLLNNDIFRTYINCSFAAPLLRLLKVRNFVFHNWYYSRSGKTAALKVAQSVWGNPEVLITSFSSTKVALESLATINNDLPLCVDEREVAGKNNDEFNSNFVYTVSNGKGKTRGSKDGGVKEFHEWKNITITTGESTITSNNSNNGVISRVLEIYGKPIDKEEDAINIHQQIMENYGAVGELFINELIKLKKSKLKEMTNFMKEVTDHLSDLKLTGITSHVTIASLLVVTDYLTHKFIFGNPCKDNSIEYGIKLLKILDVNKNIDMIEHAYETLISVFQSKAEMFHFSSKGLRLGKYYDNKYYVYQQAFDNEVIKLGFNPKTIKKGFSERGYIEHNKGTYTKQTRDSNDRARYICLIEPDYSDDELEKELIINDALQEEHCMKYKRK